MNEFFQLVYAWPFLQAVVLVYLAIVLFGGIAFVRFSRSHSGSVGSLRHRLWLAAYLGVVFTPSVLADWFLFQVPAPAFVGFLSVIPGNVASDQRFTLLLATSFYHLAPILGGSFVFYLAASSVFSLPCASSQLNPRRRTMRCSELLRASRWLLRTVPPPAPILPPPPCRSQRAALRSR